MLIHFLSKIQNQFLAYFLVVKLWILSSYVYVIMHVNESNCVCVCLQTAVEVFKRIILEAEKMDGGAPQGRTPCSMM